MTLTSTSLVLPLGGIGMADVSRVGRKAATLGELRQAGFPVPDGVVVTTEALARTLAAARLDGTAGPERIEAAALPAEVAAAVADVAGRLGGGPLAVRSSAVAEDLAGASHAGQYDSILGVPADRLPAAVRRCWASAFTGHLAAYQRFLGARPGGAGRRGAMAVLVQPMVAADAAGVAFSADPVSGDRRAVLVNAVRGLGDRLVAGRVSPDEWVVRDGDAICRAAPEGAIDAAVATAVGALARRVEAHLGTPQDIEWAMAGGELVLLQARPITALPEHPPEPVPVPAQAPGGFWVREASHAPKPWTPMIVSAFLVPRNQAGRRLFDEFGFLAETIEWAQIGGWEYLRLVPLGGKDRQAPPRWLMPLLIRAVPRMRARIRDSVAAVRADKPGRLTARWYDQWQPDLAARIPALRDVDLGALSDAELDGHTARALALAEDGVSLHFLLHGALAVSLGELAFACRDLLGWSDAQTFELVTGLSTTSTEPSRRLAELARMAAARPAARRLLHQVDATTAERLAEADPELAEALGAYQRELGCRTLRYEIAEPTIAEIPELTLRLLADLLSGGHDPAAAAAALAQRREAAAAAAQAALATRPAAERPRPSQRSLRDQRVPRHHS